MFSWFYIGTDRRWLTKLLDLLSPYGIACLVLPNAESIEADFNRSLSPDKRTTLVSDEVINALQPLECSVEQHIYTKWLAINDLFEMGMRLRRVSPLLRSLPCDQIRHSRQPSNNMLRICSTQGVKQRVCL